MQSHLVFDTILRTAKVAALKSIGFFLGSQLIENARVQIKDELAEAEEAAETPNSAPAGDDRGAEDQRQHTKDIGFEPQMSIKELATLYGAIADELLTIGTDAYERLEPMSELVARKAGKKFDPESAGVKAEVQKLVRDYRITEAHALQKLEVRTKRFNDMYRELIPALQVRVAEFMEEASDTRYEDAFGALAAVHQLKLFDVAIKGIEREAQRCRDLDRKHDWTAMLDKARDIELEIPSLVEAKRPLVGKAQLVE